MITLAIVKANLHKDKDNTEQEDTFIYHITSYYRIPAHSKSAFEKKYKIKLRESKKLTNGYILPKDTPFLIANVR